MARASHADQVGRSPLSRASIAAAALRLIDREGLPSLTMRKLGAEVGVEAMSLYGHFSTKEEILGAVVDLLFEQIDVPSDGRDWQRVCRELFAAFRRVLLSHPNAVPLLGTRSPRSLTALAPIEACVRNLRHAGFDPPTALDGYRGLMSFTIGYLLQEVSRSSAADVDPDAWGTGFYDLTELTGRDTPHLLDVAPMALSRQADEQFATGLSLVLAGLKERLAAQQPEPNHRPCP